MDEGFFLLLFRTVIGGAMLLGYIVLLRRLCTGGDVHPDDCGKPLRRQRVKMGSHFGPKTYGPRWGSWIGLVITLAPVNIIFLLGIYLWANAIVTLLRQGQI